MCDTCGCGQPAEAITFRKPGYPDHNHSPDHHDHPHDHHHDHPHPHDHGSSRIIAIEQDVLYQNNLLAERNRGFFKAKDILTYNLVSSPGSGKTTILEKTITALSNIIPMSVIEGDQQTLRDANRIAATGVPVIQVNTGNGCHLDAAMIERAVSDLAPADHSLLWIENVGNLVCPALFDLGEKMKITIISVTEGDDKPLKYPNMFHESDLCLINKIDLLPYVDFDVAACQEAARQVHSHIEFISLSATTGEGMDTWFDWIKNQIKH
ncbi:MAG: hydrogenase nickel incorporation protein HypB [Fidelibacterota bacterium]